MQVTRVVACFFFMATEKLYWNDPHLFTFNAQVVRSVEKDNRKAVILDRTAFYPEGGGQPCDTGFINGVRVTSVSSEENGEIVHFVESDVSGRVECSVDSQRRREMTQQHTGQHILSQAFFRLFGAETRGFRISDGGAEIDLAFDQDPANLTSAIGEAEDLANTIVFDDREIRSYVLTPDEASRLPLRKESFVTDCVRVVEIDDFDWSPCGGTHGRRTGEVGLIAIRGWERAKKMVRVDFLCGGRALKDYREANRVATGLARRFTVGRHEVEQSVSRLVDENKALSKRVRELAEIAARVEAGDLMTSTAIENGVRIISRVFERRDYDEIKLIAHRLTEHEATVAVLGTRQSDAARLVIARSADLIRIDCGSLMKAACEVLGGRGGGKGDFAQGGGPDVSKLEKAIADAESGVRQQAVAP